MKYIEKSAEISGRKLSFQIGKVAQQADASVLARYGDTVVLATVVSSDQKEDIGYFPLFVEYAEKLYAGGRIKGSRWVKREGRPSDDSILNARLIDRSIRPLFPKEYKKETQVIVTVLSIDKENDPDILSIAAVSCAVACSKIPWNGPIGAVRMGFVEKELVVNPSHAEMGYSDLDLVVSGSSDKVIMLEAGANQVSEKDFFEAIKRGHEEIKKIIALIEEMAKEAGVEKEKIEVKDYSRLYNLLDKKHHKQIEEIAKKSAEKEGSSDDINALVEEVFKKTGEEFSKKEILDQITKLSFQYIRKNTLEKGIRPDGRGNEDIRELSGEVSILPRTHGSAIFQRGNTQALTVTTLAAPSLEQWLESAEGEETKRYMHHYYMPPYSVGETGRMGWPSRREVGHGALAERALMPVIPREEEFPYTIRVVSEIMSSNGSTSMAAVCGSTLSLMDAGVPIKEPVVGISIGLVTAEGEDAYKKYMLLTDIMGLEDFSGDMDFKVAGTKNGITAIQLDVKIPGISFEMIEGTLERAKTARMKILDTILKVLPASRVSISKFAPKVNIIKLPQDKIGEVIGPGGKIIRQIISETGCDLNVEDDGTLTISGVDKESVEKATAWVNSIIKEIQAGEEFVGTVKRLASFGAFIELTPGKEGLVHVSQMSKGFVKNPEDIVKLGQKVKVRVIEVDDMGRIRLSMLFGEDAKKGKGSDRRNDRRGDRRSPHRRYTHPHLKSQYR